MIDWISTHRNSIIQNSFLIPILLVVIMSISHVVSWYDLGNPISWAIYLSVAIEIFALASVSAATINIGRVSIWFLFGLVTAIQIIGNVFFEYKEIEIQGEMFLSWVELISPLFQDWDLTDHRRLLALVQGGTLPLMSLTALHFYIQFNEKSLEDKDTEKKEKGWNSGPLNERPDVKNALQYASDQAKKREEAGIPIEDEPTALSNSQYRLQEEEDQQEEEEWDDAHATDMVLNDIVESLGDEEIDQLIEEVRKDAAAPGEIQSDDEFREALNLWGKNFGPYDGVNKNKILNYYRSQKSKNNQGK